MEINYAGPLAPHRQIAQWLRGRIEAGEFPADQRLPSETDIVSETGVTLSISRRGDP